MNPLIGGEAKNFRDIKPANKLTITEYVKTPLYTRNGP